MKEKNGGNDFLGILLLIFFMIGVPSFIIKEVTKPESAQSVVVQKRIPSGQDGANTFSFSSPVVDEAGIFSGSGRQDLNRFLVELNESKGIQIGVLAVSDMDGEGIESFSMRHAEKWALGQKGVDNGALLVVSMKEHAVRIETGYGTEGVLTDAKAARILRDVLVPSFKSGNYEKGIVDAVHCMAAVISEDETMVVSSGAVAGKKAGGDSVPLPVLVFVIVWVLMLFGAMTTTFRRRRSGRFFIPFAGGFGCGHDRWGSSGFGGGGSFGGGGASSGW